MADKDKDTGRPRGSGQRVVEQPRGRQTPGPASRTPQNRVGRAGTRPGVQGRPMPRAGVSSSDSTRNRDAQRQREERERTREAEQQAADQEREQAEATERGEGPGTDDDPIGEGDQATDAKKEARTRELAGVDPALRDADTSGYPPNKSTRSQQPTNLESEGGTQQPHPTVAARPAKSSMQGGPPGRSHDSEATARAIMRAAEEAGAGTAEGGIRVRATQVGYIGDPPIRRREGDVFTLQPREGKFTEPVLDEDGYQMLDRNEFPMTREVKRTQSAAEQFSANWMEPINADEEERLTTAQNAINEQHDQLLRERAGTNRRGAEGRSNDQSVAD